LFAATEGTLGGAISWKDEAGGAGKGSDGGGGGGGVVEESDSSPPMFNLEHLNQHVFRG